MPEVIFRHLFGEALRTWLLVLGTLLFLTLGLGLSRFIGDAAAGEVPVNTVLALAAFKAVTNFEIVLPVSLLLAVLLTVGRLCRDNEMASLFAGGAGLLRVYRPFLVLAALVAVFSGLMSIYAAPRAELAMDRLGAQTATALVQSLSPGRFRTLMNGKIVFYAKSRDKAGDLHGVFVRVISKNEHGDTTQTVVTASRARQQSDPDTHEVTLVLNNGWRYEGRPGQADYRVIRFAEHGVQIRPPQPQASGSVDTQSIAALLQSNDPEAIAEWQERLSVPLSIVILALLALPLGQAPPRAGRYGRVIVGILFYVVYVNAIHLATVAIDNGTLPGWIGVWWVHGLVLVVALFMILRAAGVFVRRRLRRAA